MRKTEDKPTENDLIQIRIKLFNKLDEDENQMKFILLFLLLFFYGCSTYVSVHEGNLIEQNKRMEKFDENSRRKQQYIRSSNAKKNKVKKRKKPKIRRFVS